MLAFHRNFIFSDEPTLTTAIDNRLESITVIKNHTFSLSNVFTLQSPWVTMTGRNVRYYTNTPFEDSLRVDFWSLEIEDVVTLIWDKKTSSINYIEGKKYTTELLEFWVLHTFFPLVLELANIYHVLHVSAVQIKNKTVLFSAFSGGGKSTLTDYFIQKGHVVYGDDTIAINEDKNNYEVIASYPYHRPYREPEVLGYPIVNFGTEVHSLAHIYQLEKSESNADIEIIELIGVEKFEAIYQSMFVTFENMKQERYLFATKMAKSIKVFKISIPWNKERLEEVYQAILTHNDV
jgi:hypothetical protein